MVVVTQSLTYFSSLALCHLGVFSASHASSGFDQGDFGIEKGARPLRAGEEEKV